MPPLDLHSRFIRSPAALLRATFATSRPRKPLGPRNTLSRPPPPPRRIPEPQKQSTQPDQASQGKQSSIDAVSKSLRDANIEDNNLLTPVNIPEDPDGVLTEKHPAANLLSHSSLVVTRQLEMMNVMLGFEQANRYVIMDPQGNHIGYMAERELGMGNMMARQMFTTHRSFTTHVFDKHEKEVLRFHRPFSWISSRIGVYDPLEVASLSHSASTALQNPTAGALSTNVAHNSANVSPLAISDMRIIGEAQQQWAPLRRKYNLFLYRRSPTAETDMNTKQIPVGDLPLSNSQQLQVSQASPATDTQHGEFGQFAYVDEPFLSWDFSLLSASNRLIGSVNRNWAGFGREIFTDTGVYMLRMDAAGLAQEPRHLISKTGQASEPTYDSPKVSGLTLDQRAIMLATAVSEDIDYISRKSRSSGMMPMWIPSRGGGAAEAGGAGAAGEAGAAGAAGAAGETGVGEAAGGALGGATRGAGSMGEGAAVGAGSMAGYEAMQRGAYGQSGDDASPNAGESSGFGAGQSPPDAGSQGGGEDVWGNDDDPWGGGPPAGDGGGGDGGGWLDAIGDFIGGDGGG